MERACATQRKGQPFLYSGLQTSPFCLGKPQDFPTSCSPRTRLGVFVPTLVRNKGWLRTRSWAGLLEQDYSSQQEHAGVSLAQFTPVPRYLLGNILGRPQMRCSLSHRSRAGESSGRDVTLAPLLILPGLPHTLCHIASGPRCRNLPQGTPRRRKDSAHLEFRLSASSCTSPRVRRPVLCCLFKTDHTDLSSGFPWTAVSVSYYGYHVKPETSFKAQKCHLEAKVKNV